MERKTQLYHTLIESSGLSVDELMAETAATPAAPVMKTGPSLTQCLKDPYQLLHRMDALKPTLHKDIRVPASVLHQNLSLSIIAPHVTRALITGQGTLPDPDHIFLGDPADGLQWCECGGNQKSLPLATWITSLAALVESWYGLFRLVLGVSTGAFWSSTGLALSAPFSRLYDRAPQQPLCDQANAWLNEFPCQARRFIDWVPAVLDTPEGTLRCAIPQRRGCCQKYRLPEGEYCGTCGIYREDRLSAC